MGIEALTHTNSGVKVVPEAKADWAEWVSATATRNYVLNDPILDWLALFGEGRGFKPDFLLPSYDSRTDYRKFIMAKGNEFEDAVVKHLETLIHVYNVATSPMRGRSLEAAESTFAAMQRGEPAISQAVLRDAESRTYGVADLLIRSDELFRLFPNSITAEESSLPAPAFGDSPWHYRIIDIKFSTLHFYSSGGLNDNAGSSWAYKIQVYIYNRILGRIQEYIPPTSFLLGRGWQQNVNKETVRITNCMDRLGAVPQDYTSKSKGFIGSEADAAISWVRRLRSEGSTWSVLPKPSIPELWPNMSFTSDQPWHDSKQHISSELEDLTLLWKVGLKGRVQAHESDVFRWSDPKCSPSTVGVTGPKQARILDAILAVNRSRRNLNVLPQRVDTAASEWREEGPLEFFVDFETVSNLDDDFTKIPEKGGQPLIFMIGCGHTEHGKWIWQVFTADSLTESCETEIIDSWFRHMEGVKQRIATNSYEPLVFHWSPAEQSTFEKAFNSAKERHAEKSWPTLNWFDFLNRVIQEEPVVVRGAFGFGLKALAVAMHNHGLIDTKWDIGPTDGLGAMVGAWWSSSESKRLNCRLNDIEMMKQIERYNEVDCKVMMEIVRYLRKYH